METTVFFCRACNTFFQGNTVLRLHTWMFTVAFTTRLSLLCRAVETILKGSRASFDCWHVEGKISCKNENIQQCLTRKTFLPTLLDLHQCRMLDTFAVLASGARSSNMSSRRCVHTVLHEHFQHFCCKSCIFASVSQSLMAISTLHHCLQHAYQLVQNHGQVGNARSIARNLVV